MIDMDSAVKSFSATYYNPSFIKDADQVVCPPYDVISKEQLATLREKSPYNFSNILIADNSDYKKIKTTLDEWLKKEVLIEDYQECLYLYEQEFSIEGKPYKRFGILSLLKMDKRELFPHEHTLKAPKEDRRKIIKEAKANLSPIFVIADKHSSALSQVYGHYSQRDPFFKIKDGEGNINRIWKISDTEKISNICKSLAESKLVIADGHHRFEISYEYFKENKNRFKNLNYILAYITDRQEGLMILPTHRIVNIEDKPDIFFKKLEKICHIKEIDQDSLGKELSKANKFCIGIYKDEKFYFLTLKDPNLINQIPEEAYRQLDTYIFHQLILPLFEIQGEIKYTHSISEAKRITGKEEVSFLLRPVSLDSVLQMSSKGLRFPQKSTYFYPKILSGIVLRKFQEV